MERNMEENRQVIETLLDLCVGIFLWGVLCQIVIAIFFDGIEYTLGLWIGVVLGIAGVVHMWWTLERSLDMVAKGARRTVGTQSVIRYVVLMLVIVLLAVTEFANPFFTFLGYMGMKVAAYMQSYIHKIILKIIKK